MSEEIDTLSVKAGDDGTVSLEWTQPTELDYVYVVTDHDDFTLVANSVETAAMIVKNEYGAPPQIATWNLAHVIEDGGEHWILTGHFAVVPGYPSERVEQFTVQRYSVFGRGTVNQAAAPRETT